MSPDVNKLYINDGVHVDKSLCDIISEARNQAMLRFLSISKTIHQGNISMTCDIAKQEFPWAQDCSPENDCYKVRERNFLPSYQYVSLMDQKFNKSL